MRKHWPGIVVLAAVLALAGYWFLRKGGDNDPHAQVERMTTRVVQIETRLNALAKDVDDVELLILRGSAMVAQKLQDLENDRRPEIHIGKATVYNTAGEIVIETKEAR